MLLEEASTLISRTSEMTTERGGEIDCNLTAQRHALPGMPTPELAARAWRLGCQS